MYKQLSQKQQILAIIDKYISRLRGSSTLESIRDEIMQIPDNQWIPVSERLPEYSQSVLLYKNDTVGANSIFTAIWDDLDYFKSIGVTHWMPLPKPPIS